MGNTKLQKLAVEIAKTQARLDKLTQQAAALHRAEIGKVEIIKNDRSVTLVFNDRKINARKNRYGRYLVKEGSQILDNDYFGSIHDLRFAIATGGI